MAINMAESMFARVGGTPAITALIDLLYSKITVNASTSPFFENKDLARVKAKQVEFFSNALGSGTAYTGRGMVDIHTGLGINDDEFNIVAGYLSDSLKELNVPQDIYDAVMGLAGSLRGQVVGL